MVSKNAFIGRRTDIISKMLDNPDKHGIYPTTVAFAELDDLFDEMMRDFGFLDPMGSSWAQIDRDRQCKTQD